MTRRPTYEVGSGMVEVTSPAGHKHWLGYGDELPDWVDQATIDRLLAEGVVTEFGWV